MTSLVLMFFFAAIAPQEAIRSESESGPDDVDDFLASLDMTGGDPVNTVNNAGLQTPGTQSSNPMVSNAEAVEEIVEVRDREDQMHVSEAHRMKCSEILRNAGQIGEQRGRTSEQSTLIVAENQTVYSDPNDDPLAGGSSSNGHPSHSHNCHAVRDHSVRKVAMVGELDMPPFFEKLGEFDIAGLDHGKAAEGELFSKVVWTDTTSTFEDRPGHVIRGGVGLATVKPDGKPVTPALRQWIITSRTWDKEVKPKLDEIAKELAVAKKFGEGGGQHHADGLNCDNAFDNYKEVDFKVEMGCLLKAIEQQEKFIPFNHKLERIDLDFYTCRKAGSSATCDRKGQLYLHDGKLLMDSSEVTRMNALVASTSTNALSTASYLPEPGLKVLGGAAGGGMEMEGSISWSVTVSKKGNCAPAMQPILYVGIGTDSDVDLDLGATLYSWEAGGGMFGTRMKRDAVIYYGATGQKPGQIGEDFQVRKCEMSGGRGAHTPTSARLSNCGAGSNAMVEYSGDNLDGSGEGDDEWMAFDLEKLQKAHVTHIAVVVNVYSGDSFEKLEGSFFRAVMADRGEKSWATAQTVEYVDLDEMKSARGMRAAILATFFIDDLAKLLLPADAKKESVSHEQETSPEVAALKAKLMGLAGKIKAGSASSSEQAEFNQAKKDFTLLGKTRFETVVSKHAMNCPSSGCSLPNVYGEIENYFTRAIGPVKESGGGSKTTAAQEKAKDADAVTLHDLDGTSNPEVSDVDDFLASLEQDIPPNNNLGAAAQPTSGVGQQVDAQAQAMSESEFQKGLLIEFPAGPPGSDTLCVK